MGGMFFWKRAAVMMAPQNHNTAHLLYMIFDCASCSSCCKILRDGGTHVGEKQEAEPLPVPLLYVRTWVGQRGAMA